MDETALHRLLHLRTWQQVFETNALLRGFVYAAQGKVRSLSVQPVGPHAAVLTAQVRGRARQDYVCQIAIQAVGTQLHLGGDCTCPMARDCKHVVAALTVTGENPPVSWPRAPGDALSASAPAPGDELATWRHWLGELQKPSGPGPGVDIARAGDVFALLLRTGQGAPWPRLQVAPVWLSPGKNKPWVSPRSPTMGPRGPVPAPVQGWPEGVLESLVLLGDCPVERAGALQWSRPVTAYHDYALATLIREVPVHFERAGAQPLRIDDDRTLDLHWQMQSDGSQRLQAQVEGAPRARLLRGEGLWFLDEEQAVADDFLDFGQRETKLLCRANEVQALELRSREELIPALGVRGRL